jgi:cellulose biosynthesis protein BcsQ
MSLGHKVCLIDFDNISYDLSASFNKAKDFMLVTSKDFNQNGLMLTTKNKGTLLEEDYALCESKLNELKTYYDYIIIDTSSTSISITPVQLMKLADLNLYVIKVNFTTISYISNADLLVEEYGLKNTHFILNNAHKASNYNGNLIGSGFESKARNKGFINKIKQYINYYI